MPIIENEYLKIAVKLNGGSLTSIYDKKNNKELLYQPDGKSWNGQDVVIFPFIARLKDGCYKYQDETYSMKNHGLIRYNTLRLIDATSTTLTLSFIYNDETLKQYPYKFYFEVKYILNLNELIISYKIQNIDNKTIYYEFGGHPAIKASGVIDNDSFEYTNTSLEFVYDLDVKRYILNDEGSYIIGCEDTKLPMIIDVNKKMITDHKTLIYDANNIDNIILKTNGFKFDFNISEAEILAIWTMEGMGDYICIEPWWGIPDYINPNLEFKDKPLMHSLNPGCTETKKYSIKIEKNGE